MHLFPALYVWWQICAVYVPLLSAASSAPAKPSIITRAPLDVKLSTALAEPFCPRLQHPALFLPGAHKTPGVEGRLGGFLPWVLNSEQAREGSASPCPGQLLVRPVLLAFWCAPLLAKG